MACCIGCRLAGTVQNDINIEGLKRYFWTDSSTALCWIQREIQWSVFVRNRVKEIRSVTVLDEWHHVSGNNNPADLPSRGCTARRLLDLKWWEGPSFLKMPEDKWPKSTFIPDEEMISQEVQRTVTSASCIEREKPWYYGRFSSYEKTLRTLAWIQRFIKNCKLPIVNRKHGELKVDEIKAAEHLLFVLIQMETFLDVKDKRLVSLRPFFDEQGIIRANSQVAARDDTDDFRFPIILPGDHPMVTLFLRFKHKELCHAGIQVLMANLRQRFWILKSRQTIRRIIRGCQRCRRFSAMKMEVPSPPLPADRVKEASVFEVTGVDMAGPLFLKGGNKVWITLFTCAVYRAVHLELTSSLSTDAFLQTLRRFIARRGRVKILYSDNGTNFVGSDNALQRLDWEEIECQTSVQQISWVHSPPSAPWWGGWWERLIRMVKDLLRRVLGRSSLNYEELMTVLCDCESVINSRPITYVSEEIDDDMPISPAMFLRDLPDNRVPDIDHLEREGFGRRFRYRQTVRDHLRKRFRAEYLGQLKVQVGRRFKDEQSLTKGQIVFISRESSKPLDWPIGKIEEVFPGKDGRVRVVRVRTQQGSLLRPVQTLIPLEVDGEVRDEEAKRLRRSLRGKRTVSANAD